MARFGLLGASGCGKTTLLRCILSSLDPDYGEITVLGLEPGITMSHVPGRDIGYMPQDIGLISEFTAFELMIFFGVLHRMPFKKIRERIHYLVELLELPPLQRRVTILSGGQQRRVSFAVALLQEPSLLILDEPTVGLDPLLRVKIWRHLVELTTTKQSTVIITTHYIEEAKMAHNVGFMRDGILLAQSSPENLMRAYNTTSLEAVFLKLAYDSSKRGDKDVDNVPDQKEYSLSEQTSSSDKTDRKCKILNFHKFRVPTTTNILAMSIKSFWKMCKSFLHIILLVLLPAVQITFYCATVGNDVKDVKLLFTNNDTSKIYPLLSSRAALILVLVLGRYCCFMKYQIDHYIAVDTTAHARIKQHPFVLVYFGYLKVSIIIAPLFDYCLNINFLTFVSLLYYMTSELTWYTTSKERMAPITLIIKSNKQLHYCNVHSHSVSFSALLQPIYNEEQYEKHLCNQSSHHRNYD